MAFFSKTFITWNIWENLSLFRPLFCGGLTDPARKVCSQKNTGKVWGPVGDPKKGRTYPLKGAVWYYQCLSPPRPLWAEVGRERLAGRDNPHHHTRRGSVSQAEPPLEYFMHYVASIGNIWRRKWADRFLEADWLQVTGNQESGSGNLLLYVAKEKIIIILIDELNWSKM